MFPNYNNSSVSYPNGYVSGIGYGSSGGGGVFYPTSVTVTPHVGLVGVMESPAAELDNRGWLDAQIDEVCALAC